MATKWQNMSLAGLAVATAIVGVIAFRPATAPDVADLPARPTASAAPMESAFFTGDSLTVGWSAQTEADSFRPLIVDSLAERGLSDDAVTVAARAGAPLAVVARDYDVPAGVDLVVVELGTNDADQGTDPDAFGKDYAAYLDRIRKASPDAQLVCLGVWFLSSRPETAPLDEAIESACTEHGGKFRSLTKIVAKADMRGPAGADTWVGPADEFHPNNAGHKQLASIVLRAID